MTSDPTPSHPAAPAPVTHNPNQNRNTVPAASSALPPSRIAVFGETLVDLFDTGPVVGGAPFNVARHLAALGCAPLVLTAVGTDANAAAVRCEFARYGLRTDGLQTLPERPTGVVDVHTMPGGGHRFAIRGECAYDFIRTDALAALPRALVPDGWLYYGTLGLRGATSLGTWRALLAAHRGPRYVDLNWRDGHTGRDVALEAIAAADVLKVNDEEVAMLLGWLGWLGLPAPAPASVRGLREAPGRDALRACLQRFSLRLLVVTCGADGYLAFDGQGHCIAAGRNGRPVALVDTVGAGDAFSAVVLAGLLGGWDIAVALQRADTFAGQVCEVRGAVPPRLEAYRAWTAGWTQK